MYMEKSNCNYQEKDEKSKEDWILDIIIYTLAVVILFITVYPFIMSLCCPLMKDWMPVLRDYWLPRKFTLTNYSKFLLRLEMGERFRGNCGKNRNRDFLGVLFTTLVAYGIL